jgi:hypothetical protein
MTNINKRNVTLRRSGLLISVIVLGLFSILGSGGGGGGGVPPATDTTGVWDSSTWDSSATWGT